MNNIWIKIGFQFAESYRRACLKEGKNVPGESSFLTVKKGDKGWEMACNLCDLDDYRIEVLQPWDHMPTVEQLLARAAEERK